MCHKEFSIILKLTDEFTLLGYNKWFANIDKISEEKSNLRILGINQTEIIIVYDNILLTADCRKILNLLSKSHINFIYITDLIELK